MKEISGFAKNPNDGVDRVCFRIEDGDFRAFLNGDIWDLSSDIKDFIKYCNNKLYCSLRIENDELTYGLPVDLKKWFKENKNGN